MSAGEGTTGDGANGAGDDGPPRREVAQRVLAAEFDAATLSYAESDEDRAPTYVVTPTGARANRVFHVGVLTAVETVNDGVLRARVSDPTGTVVVYAGQYQPEARAFFDGADTPAFVAVTGKARTFSPDDSDRVFTSIRPETVAAVDGATRDRWAVDAAERTIERIDTLAAALAHGVDEARLRDAGLPPGLAAGIPRAVDHYGTTPDYLRDLRRCAREAAELVAGDRDEVTPPGRDPGDGNGEPGDLPTTRSLVDFGAGDAPPAAEGSGAETAATTADAETAAAPADTGTATTTAETPAEGSEPESATGPVGADAGSPAAESGDAGEPAAATSVASSGNGSTTDASGAADRDESADGSAASGPDQSADSTAVDAEADTETSAETTASDDETDEATESDGAAAGGDVPDDPTEFELDEEERERIESEFGTDFETGTEVGEPGTADIDVPDPEAVAAEADEAVDGTTDASTAGAGATGAETDADTESTGTGGGSEDTPPDEDGGDAPVEATTDGAAVDPTDAADGTGEAGETAGAGETEPDGADRSDETDPDTADEPDGPSPDEPDAADEPEPEVGTETDEPETEADTETDEDVDLEDAVVDAMAALDDGDGADRAAVVDRVRETTGADEAAVADAIDAALMDGRCYEPGESTLKPI